MTWEPIMDNIGQIRGVRMAESSQRVIRWDGICDPYTDWGQQNARLILAAPLMLEALEEIARWSEEDDENLDTCRMQWRGCVAIARTTIAKAKGES